MAFYTNGRSFVKETYQFTLLIMNRQSNTALATEMRTIVTRLIKRLRKQSATGRTLSLTQRSTLALLDEHGELLPNELASMEKITNQSMSQVLAYLGELGYIKRRTAEDDKRKSIVSLTKEGAAILKQVRSERDSWLYKAINSNCSDEEVEILRKAMIPLKRILDFEAKEK
jgi:DNA-binding MarR family transcriptional regulator